MAAGKRTHRRDRVARRFVYVLFGVGLLALFAPAIVGSTGLRQWALDRAVPASVGKLTASGANLSWWSPVQLSGVQLTDPVGTVVFRAATVRVDRSLWQLANDSKNLGTIRVDRPMVAVYVRPDGSNVEDLIALLEQESAAKGEPAAGGPASTPLQIEITGGAVQVVEAAGQQRSWVVDEINASIDTAPAIPSVAASAIVYAGAIDNAAAPVRQAGQVAPARNSGSVRIENTTGDRGQQLALTVERMPLEPLEPWLARFDTSLRLAGTVTGKGGAQWRPSPPTAGVDRATAILQSGLVTSGVLTANALTVESAALGDRPVRLTRAQTPWRVRTTADGRLAIEQFDLLSELGDTKLRTTLGRDELAAVIAGDWLAPRSATIESDLDLAQLARVAPGVVRLRQGAAIQAGRARVSLASQPSDPTRPTAGRRINATADTSDLTAVVNGRVIEWNRPLVLRAAATQDPGGLRVDEFVCQSEFLNATASGNASGVNADVRFDLDRLTQQLGRFVDLTGWRLAGRGQAKVAIQRPAADRFQSQANVDLTDAIVATPDRTLLNERRLVGALSVGGVNDASLRPTRVDAANIEVTAGDDQLAVRTTGTITADGGVPIDARLTGDLANWLTRLRLVAPEAAKQIQRLAGAAEVTATGVVAADRFSLSQFNFAATGFELDAGDVRVREPRVEASGSLMVDPNAARLAADELRVVSSAASALGRGLSLSWGGAGPPSSGRLAVRADLARLSNWLASQQQAGAIRPVGGVTGDVTLTEQQGRVVATLDLTGQQIALQQATATAAPATLWQSPTLKLRGQAAYAPAADQLTFRDLAVDSPTLRGSATGQVNRLQSDAELQINGVVDYDLQQWAPVIAAKLGPGFRIAGRDQATFQIAGKLRSSPPPRGEGLGEGARRLAVSQTHWSQRLTGRVEAPWSSAVAYGLPIGPGRLGLALSQGVVRADPLVVALGGGVTVGGTPGADTGRLTLQPAVRLDPPPAQFGLPAGPVLTNVRITPEISEEMLKYVAPVLQGATRSEGVFSLSTNGASAPLADMKQIDVAGQLAVQSVRVVPGPRVEQLISVVQQIESLTSGGDAASLLGLQSGNGQPTSRQPTTLLSIDDRTIDYRVVGGRVYHQAVPFRAGNVAMQSSGSVGFDETLDLVFTVAIPDNWVEGKPLLVGLRGQSLQIPVRGTLSDWKIDNRAIRDLSRQIVRDTASGALGNEIGRALDRLFD